MYTDEKDLTSVNILSNRQKGSKHIVKTSAAYFVKKTNGGTGWGEPKHIVKT